MDVARVHVLVVANRRRPACQPTPLDVGDAEVDQDAVQKGEGKVIKEKC